MIDSINNKKRGIDMIKFEKTNKKVEFKQVEFINLNDGKPHNIYVVSERASYKNPDNIMLTVIDLDCKKQSEKILFKSGQLQILETGKGYNILKTGKKEKSENSKHAHNVYEIFELKITE